MQNTSSFTYSLLVETSIARDSIEKFVNSIRSQDLGVVFLQEVDQSDQSKASIVEWEKHLSISKKPFELLSHSAGYKRQDRIKQCMSDWIIFHDASKPFAPDYFEHVECLLQKTATSNLALIAISDVPSTNRGNSPSTISIGNLEKFPASVYSLLFPNELIIESCLELENIHFPRETDWFCLFNYLIDHKEKNIATIEISSDLIEVETIKRNTCNDIDWRNPDSYNQRLLHKHLRVIHRSYEAFGRTPLWLQRFILRDLSKYFILDMQVRSPTGIISGSVATELHEIFHKILSYLDVDQILALSCEAVRPEIIHALLSYKGLQCQSEISADCLDREQGLIRLRYFVHGRPASERFNLDGKRITPVFEKSRAGRFFCRNLYQERIIWIPVEETALLSVFLDGEPAKISADDNTALIRKSFFYPATPFRELYATLPKGKRKIGGGKPTKLGVFKALLLKGLSSLPIIRHRFRNAWVFADHDSRADDNAEHLYRWILNHHPEINAWYLLPHSSGDWERLDGENFRLMPPGIMQKVLILCAKYIISSHDNLEYGGMDPNIYGEMMRWRFIFLQHGVIKDDLSPWLSNRSFDLFLTSSPNEYASIVEDGSPYTYTSREIHRTGLPRHDRLLTIATKTAPTNIRKLLVMPTWRSSLVSDRRKTTDEVINAVSSSSYVKHWKSFLNNRELHELASKYMFDILFMPHPGALQYLDAFEIPEVVQIGDPTSSHFQTVFCESLALITDYSSVSFEMALLRRQVFYYQFDRASFYGGDHNFREGYFDYERDGFGPLANNETQLISELTRFFESAVKPEAKYLSRMTIAMPDQDGKSCERAFHCIEGLSKKYDPKMYLASDKSLDNK